MLMGYFQRTVGVWLETCFGTEIAEDKTERSHRFLEEALELVQSAGCTKEEALQLVDYVYDRPVGELTQEIGGVAVTLAAFCHAHCISLDRSAETELHRCWMNTEKIRAKQAAKPKFGPLPGAAE